MAGRESFLKHGFNRAAVADIARDADVSTATLYKHFSSKEALFATVVREICSGFGSEFSQVSESNDVRQILFDLAQGYLAAQFDHGANALLRIVIAEVPTAPQVAIDTHAALSEQRHGHLKRTLDKLIERKLLKPHNTDTGIDLLSGMIKEVLIWPALFDADFKLPADADEIIYEVIDTYLARYAA
ncbi:MAG: TetR/AcrR family transcriptional regulator [Parvibaculum sp.]|nr:TetR/AcrR family transcriptional regulator [Parvibaculum sp.]